MRPYYQDEAVGTQTTKEKDMCDKRKENANKPKTLREGLNRLRNPDRNRWCWKTDTSTMANDLADILEILIVMGFDTDGRSLDIDVTNFRPMEPKEGDGA